MELALLKKKFLGNDDIWDIDFQEPKFDRDLTVSFGSKHRGSIRLSMGLFYTDEEWNEIRQDVLKTPLP